MKYLEILDRLHELDSEIGIDTEVVIYCPVDAHYDPFLEINNIEYNYEENRIHIITQ